MKRTIAFLSVAFMLTALVLAVQAAPEQRFKATTEKVATDDKKVAKDDKKECTKSEKKDCAKAESKDCQKSCSEKKAKADNKD